MTFRFQCAALLPALLLLSATVVHSAAPNSLSDPGAFELSPKTVQGSDLPAPSTPLAAPTILYSSYFGGSDDTTIAAIKVNASGEIYIAGTTDSINLPTNAGQRTNGGSYDGFVAKFAADGHTLIYCTYIGGALYEELTGLALDASGNAYVSGFVRAVTGELAADAFVVKVVQNGASVTFLKNVFGAPPEINGYHGNDHATAIAAGPGNTLVLVGWTTSTTGLTPLNAISSTLSGTTDGFIRRYDSNLTLLSSTYYGGSDAEEINAVVVGGSGNITVAGSIVPQNTLNPHVWVGRTNPAASVSSWSKQYSGTVSEEAFAVRIDAAGNPIVGGYTNSGNFSTMGSVDATYNGNGDGFLMEVNATTGGLLYSSYVGTAGIDGIRAIETMPNGDVVVAGYTQSNLDPTTGGFSRQAFVQRFNANLGSLDYPLTAFGTSQFSDTAYALARDPNGTLWIAGIAGGSDLFTTGDAYMGQKPGFGSPSGFYMCVASDEDLPPALHLSAATYTIAESAASVTITVQRDGPVTSALGVHYATSNGSALAGSDYTATSGDLPFAAGQSSATFSVPILNDTLDEIDEAFTITLSAPTGGAVLGTPSTASVTITDNDNPPTIGIDTGGCQVTEGNTGTVNCSMVFRLSAVSGKAVTFNTATGGGTATPGSDYVAQTSTPHTIAAGQTTLTVAVTVKGDTVEEVDETFNLNVSAVTNASPASFSGVGTIVDDDEPSDRIFRSGFQQGS
ncbi:MAG: Calx-beta domain-containing protein [Tahibacter sp.]